LQSNHETALLGEGDITQLHAAAVAEHALIAKLLSLKWTTLRVGISWLK